MTTVNKAIEVEVPVSVAYNQWTQFESFPEFMNGVESVEQIDETALHFSTNVGGVKRDYNAQVLDQVPDSLVSWASIDGPRNAGSVRFEPLGPDRTRVSVEIEWEPEGFVEKAGSLVGIDDLRVSADLDKFKDFIEGRGRETGAWRGTVTSGDVDDTGEGPAAPITSELPAIDPDLSGTAGTDPAEPGGGLGAPSTTEEDLRVGQYTEGDYGAERVGDVPREAGQGDYTTEEARPGETRPGREAGPRPTES